MVSVIEGSIVLSIAIVYLLNGAWTDRVEKRKQKHYYNLQSHNSDNTFRTHIMFESFGRRVIEVIYTAIDCES